MLDPLSTEMLSRLNPPLSNASVISCGPAASVTGTVTSAQFCQPPVAAIGTAVQTALEPLKPRCSEPLPAGDAVRSRTV